MIIWCNLINQKQIKKNFIYNGCDGYFDCSCVHIFRRGRFAQNYTFVKDNNLSKKGKIVKNSFLKIRLKDQLKVTKISLLS